MATDTIVRVDPKTLRIAPNVRKNTKITDAWVASLQEHGVKVPIEVRVDVEGAYEVLDGQRRTLGAIKGQLADVPIIVSEVAGDADRIVDQLVMNDQREQLSRGERVHAVQELALIGVAAAEISKRTSVKVGEVERALAIANSAPALEALDAFDITLDQAAALVEFQDDKKVLADLTERARNNRQFDYAVTEARKKRKLEASKKELVAKLKADGVTKVSAGDFYSYGKGPGRQLSDLVNAAGKEITAAAHKKCPGHAGYVEAEGYYSDKARIVYVCTDWEANGHTKKHHGYVESDAERKKREAREKAQALRDEQKAISAELRETFIVGLLQRDVAKLDGVHLVVAEALAGWVSTYANRYYSSRDWREIALSFLGVEVDEETEPQKALAEYLSKPGSKPLVVSVASALALQEFVHGAFRADEATVDYLQLLARWGYALSDFEASEIEGAKKSIVEEAERQAKIAADRAEREAKEAAAA